MPLAYSCGVNSAADVLIGELKKESIFINKSLFTLRKVISTLAGTSTGPKVHVPYRDSKLTCLLKGSIGGSSLTLMIACIAKGDRHYEENLSTLEYASQAKRVVNKVRAAKIIICKLLTLDLNLSR